MFKIFMFVVLFFLSFGCEKKKEVLPEGMVKVKRGEFLMGTVEPKRDGKEGDLYFDRVPFYKAEYPQRKVFVDTFFIDKYEVTNERYKNIVPKIKFNKGLEKHPVVLVSWAEASQFCKWERKELPTEAQWEKAARGTDGRIYPWGNEFDERKLNTGKFSMGTTPVGVFDNGISPYGAFDMAGNVWEWTNDWFKPYSGNDYDNKRFGENFKVIRGGARIVKGHYNMSEFFRTSHRLGVPVKNRAGDTGFRCVAEEGG